MSQVTLSIIIPIYNVEEYLGECLDSVLSQDLKNCEVICVNDGSTDHSRAILQEYKSKFSDLIILDKENEGLSAARNSGTEMAKGEYIYYLDSDDYLLPDKLSLMYNFARINDLDVACFNSTTVANGSFYFTPKVELKEITFGENYYSLFYKKNGFFPVSPVWMYLFKRDFLINEDLQFTEGRIHEDEQFTPRVFLKASKVLMLNTPVLMHRINRSDSIATGYKRINQIDRLKNCQELFPIFSSLQKERSVFLHSLFNIYNSVAENIMSNDISFRKSLFTEEAYRTWKSCTVDKDYYFYYFLFRRFPIAYRWYINQTHPKLHQKCIKLGSRLLFKLLSDSKNE